MWYRYSVDIDADYTKKGGIKMVIIECVQCKQPVYARRTTRKFCSEACKQKHKRGVAPEAWYLIFDDSQARKDEEWLAVIAQSNKRLFRQFQSIKAKYGHNAMLASLHILQDYSERS